MRSMACSATANPWRKKRHAKYALTDTITEVIKSDPGVSKLLAEFAALQREIQERRSVLNLISSKFGIPDQHRHWDVWKDYPPAASLALWRAAFEALETDADAALPS
jgi:hypothetical protein